MNERQTRTSERLRSICKRLKRPYRKPSADRLERFALYFDDYGDERVEEFISRIGTTKAAIDPDFSLNDIVTKNMIGSMHLGKGTKRASVGASSFYKVITMEV